MENMENEKSSKLKNIIYVCSICYGHYVNLISLKEHIINTHKYVTKSTKNSKGEIQSKVKTKNLKVNPIAELPSLTFPELKLLLRKNLTHRCAMKGCSYKFDSKEKQETHIRCHSSSDVENRKDFKCFDCGFELKNWRNCTGHMWIEHEIDVDLLSCPLCSYKAITSIKIWRHMKVHKFWKPKTMRSNRKTGKITSIKNKNKYYSEKTCDICSRNFANGKTLSKHIKAVHNKIKPFSCNVCGRKSARKSTWLIHMRQHTDEKLQCKYCSFRARDPSVIKKHEDRHKGKNSGQYKCMICSYTSIQTSSFKQHVKYYHPEEYRKISCDQCNFVTITSKRLEFHKKDHVKGLILNEDSMDAINLIKNHQKNETSENFMGNIELSSDCFFPLESTESIADTGGVTIPAHADAIQFPNFLNL